MDTFVTAIKQYPGQVQVTRSVKVKVPATESRQSGSGALWSASKIARPYWAIMIL